MAKTTEINQELSPVLCAIHSEQLKRMEQSLQRIEQLIGGEGTREQPGLIGRVDRLESWSKTIGIILLLVGPGVLVALWAGLKLLLKS